MEESIADKYYNLLEQSENKAAVLIGFLRACGFDFQQFQFIGRLVKLYGANTVFFAILSLASSGKSAIDSDKIQGYLGATCKNIFEEKHVKNQATDLTTLARQMYRRLHGSQ